MQLADVELARYRSDRPTPSPALSFDGKLLVGLRGALHAVTGDGQIAWETPP